MILINPASTGRMGMISRYSIVSLPIGVGTLAGYLLSKGKQVKIIDELINPVDRFLSDIDTNLASLNKPYIFGISCLTINIGRAFQMAKLLKAKYPDSKVIMGGIHATALPEEALTAGNADIVVRGEGEETLLLLYDAIKSGQSYRDIGGISFIENNNIKHNPSRPLQNLDILPLFPYNLFDADKYNLDFVMTSRGCPFNCIFCSQRLISGRRYRFRALEVVIEELGILINKYNQRSISFVDDDFLVDKKRVKLLCELIVKNKFNLKANFGCQTRADNVKEDILVYLKNAGFTFVGLGIEAGSERLMKIIQKGETLRANLEAVKLLKRKGFYVYGFFIFGLPSETSEERLNAYLLAKRLRLYYAKFNNAVPYPGTYFFEIAKKEGTLNISRNWENFNSVGSVVDGIFSKSKLPYIPSSTTERELRRDIVRANLYFYLTNFSLLFSPKKGNPGWFLLPPKWYFSPREYYYLIKLILKVILNCIIVFNFKWAVREAFGAFRKSTGVHS